METKDSIINKVLEIASVIDCKPNLIPSFEYNPDGESIDVDLSGTLYYLVSERGREIERYSTYNVDDFLYKVFSRITSGMAEDFTVNNRNRNVDFRRQLFAEQLRLMSLIDPNWGPKIKLEHEKILYAKPYDDYASIRVDYIVELRGKGLSSIEASQLAYKKYPISTKNVSE